MDGRGGLNFSQGVPDLSTTTVQDGNSAAMFRRPRLKRTVEPIDAPDGSTILMRASANDVVLENLTDAERDLLRALDGTVSRSELDERFGATIVGEVLEQLDAWRVLDDAADEDGIPARVKERLDRQLRYFSDVTPGVPSASQCQQRLADARVVVLGAGGLGGRIALDLAAMGVGHIRLTDGDRLELSNLNRQIQYSEPDIGRLKAEVMAERLRAFNSEVEVDAACDRLESKEELEEFIKGATFVVGSADWPPYVIEHWCNAACFALGIPYIAMNQLPPFVRIGPTFVPGRTGCFDCEMTRYRREHPLMDEAIEQRRDSDPVAATLSPTTGMVSSLVSMEVLHFLTGLVEPASLGVGLTLDTRTMTIERDAVIQERGCPTCGG